MSFWLCCCSSAVTSPVEKYNQTNQAQTSQPLGSTTSQTQTNHKAEQIQSLPVATETSQIVDKQKGRRNNFLAPPPTPSYLIEKSTASRSSRIEENEQQEHKSTLSHSYSSSEVEEVLIFELNDRLSALKTKEVKRLCITGNPGLPTDARRILKVIELVTLEQLEIRDSVGFFSGQFFEQKLNRLAIQLFSSLYSNMQKLQSIHISGRSIIKRSPSLERITLNPIKIELLIKRK